mmetsp:Transcript_33073/g.31515  ORF Transcript_33073/g.31515 Transcript_33073/m.31515 type:complete len:143 (+) Transcript_33073:97-525(+)
MATVSYETCPTSAPFFGFMGVTAALCFANIGAAYGTAKSGVGIASMGVMNPGLVMRNIIPVVMAGVLGIYGLIVAVIIQGSITIPAVNGATKYSSFTGYAHLSAGLCCGLRYLFLFAFQCIFFFIFISSFYPLHTIPLYMYF